ncbi:uncharacterized protein B0T15DRAFT_488455 [Chaetomium strumarium]|uniref:Uncharacterized protein n=1 Tax=Chaetomium strumarium TaxID=1170767 RepID=A0AAJ0H1D8_9PEZI|nr:hypothetical protein B0T15DRAFT_488455 [Chaetomium strumarium]
MAQPDFGVVPQNPSYKTTSSEESSVDSEGLTSADDAFIIYDSTEEGSEEFVPLQELSVHFDRCANLPAVNQGVQLLQAIAALQPSATTLQQSAHQRFNQVDQRFDQRFDQMDQRFNHVDQRLNRIDIAIRTLYSPYNIVGRHTC